jgi:hypothetical protein
MVKEKHIKREIPKASAATNNKKPAATQAKRA